MSDRYSSESTKNRTVTVAATQMSCISVDDNNKKAESLVRIAASRGAQVILLQHMFQHSHFLHEAVEKHFQLAEEAESSLLLRRMSAIAKELKVVLPISFFEKKKNDYYSSVAMIDADGSILGIYRQSHLMTAGHLHEQYYFTPSEAGFQVWKTKYGCLGVALSSDQWFPETARAMVLQGAELLLFPSMMGELDDSETRTSSSTSAAARTEKEHWQRVMQGHAAANVVPVITSNRVGTDARLSFCGSSFITGPVGEMLKIADRESEGVLVETFDLDAVRQLRAAKGLLRDRRPHLYRVVATRDGQSSQR